MFEEQGEITIRRAAPEDDAQLGELLVTAYVAGYAKKLPHIVVSEARKRDLRAVSDRRDVAIILVAELHESRNSAPSTARIVGTVAIWPAGKPGSEAWIDGAVDLRHLATAPDLHGRGLSRILLDEAERIVRDELRATTICLHVRRGNEGVRAIYEARGYVRDESGDLEYPGVSLMAFAKQLSIE